LATTPSPRPAEKPPTDLNRKEKEMPTQPEDPPIIVSGGSVTVDFDKDQLKENAAGKHHHPHKKIKRVEISGDDINFAGETKTGKVTIKIFYGD
jgi:hypothetical protein